MKKIGLILFALFVMYIIYIYITGKRETYLIPKGYEGALLIIGHQKDGIEISAKHSFYDFTNGNIIKLKGNLITGFSPLGYENYYAINEKGERERLETINEDPEKVKEDKIYAWTNYFEIGSCNEIDYEVIVISKKVNIDRILDEKEKLVNHEVCNRKTIH
jgi:hypothetical protein